MRSDIQFSCFDGENIEEEDSFDIGTKDSSHMEYLNKPQNKRSFTSRLSISIGGSLNKLSSYASSTNISELFIDSGVRSIVEKMSHRLRDSHDQPSSLPRRYFSLPKSYQTQNSSVDSTKDSSLSSRYRSSSSTSTPSSQSLQLGSSRTCGSATSSVLTDVKRPFSRRSGSSALSPSSRTGNLRKNSYPLTSSSSVQTFTPSYTTKHVFSTSRRGSSSSLGTSSDFSWARGEMPVRQRSSISLRETSSVWGPDGPPKRQNSSSSLRNSPFIKPGRSYSSTGLSDSETHSTSRKKRSLVGTERLSRSVSPTPTVSYAGRVENKKRNISDGKASLDKVTTSKPVSPDTRVWGEKSDATETRDGLLSQNSSSTGTMLTSSISPPTVEYKSSEPLEERSPSPKSPIVQYSGGVLRKESPSSKSEVSSSGGSRRSSGANQGSLSDNGDDDLESSAARDISVLSREIASTYEGSLGRSDSRKGRFLSEKEKINPKTEENCAKGTKAVDKEGSCKMKANKEKQFLREKSPPKEKSTLVQKGHKRSSSTGSTVTKDDAKKSGKKFSAVFSRKKPQSTDSVGEEERSRHKGLLPHKGSKESLRGNSRRGSSPSAHSVSPLPRRKTSSPGRFINNYSSDSQTASEEPKKFSVPGKFFANKESKSGAESSDLEAEGGRASASLKRRVSLPGMLGFQRSSSAERASTVASKAEPSLDPALLRRRRSNFKKAQSFDVNTDPSKNSMLNKLKFWDLSKKDRSPEEGRPPSSSPAESLAQKISKNPSGEEFKKNSPATRRGGAKTVGVRASSQLTDSGANKKLEYKHSKVSPKVKHTAKGDSLVKNSGKNTKVVYVGPVTKSSPSQVGARKQGQKKVTVENKESVKHEAVATDAEVKKSEVGGKEQAEEKAGMESKKNVESKGVATGTTVQKSDATKVNKTFSEVSTRDTVSKLRERRRRRREERERFFAGTELASKESSEVKDTMKKDQGQQESESTEGLVSENSDGKNNPVDGKITSEKRDETSQNHKKMEPTPKLGVIGKMRTVDDVLENGHKVNFGKLRSQTIASSVHADIISDLIREKGLKMETRNEVKIPSVAELRIKFMNSKDDGKILPSRTILKLSERPNSVCGEILSPTEMKKFDDINFSLAKKSSVEDVEEKKFPNSSSDSLLMDGQWKPSLKKINTTSPPLTNESTFKGEKKDDDVAKEENKVETTEQEELSINPSIVNDTLKRRRGSKTKKRKKSIFGTDKEKEKEKEKEPKSPDEETDVPQHGAVSAAIKAMFTRRPSTMEKTKSARKQRLKSAPESTTHSEALKSGAERERTMSAPGEISQKSPEVPPAQEHAATKIDRVQARVSNDHKKEEKMQEGKNDENSKGIELQLQPLSEIQEKPKERKSLKKPSANKKRVFKSTMKPFGLTKTKSESNLSQLRFVSVDIPLDNEPEEEKKNNDQLITNEPDKIIRREETKDSQQQGRKPSVFEESVKEFYQSSTTEEKGNKPMPEVTLEDLDAVSGQTTQQLKSVAEDRMKIRPRRHHRTTTNPVKSLQQRNDVRTDTEVERPRIEKKPVTSEHPIIKRKKKKYKDPDNLWRRHTLDLAASALAGLASTEDFTKVRLRKTAGPDEKDEYRGTKSTMLIHIKGRRNLQVRLVEPSVRSLNSGDCFALVTEKDLFSWIGRDCNPYEKAKVTEIVSKIKAKSELDCRARDIVTIEDGDADYGAALEKFLRILKDDSGSKEIRDAKSMPKDEEYEKGCVRGNMVYKMHWTDPPTLMPVESMCGHIPQVAILDTKEVFIFDFGSELYVWNGQQSLSGQRKSAFALAKQLYDEPFKPYGIFDPIFPYGKPDNGSVEVDNKIASQRPPWTLFARLHEKAETILFREKFLDWPDPTKIIRMKGHPSMLELSNQEKPPPVELKPCDVKSMLKCPPPLECPSFEGVNVGRGKGIPTVCVGDIYREGNLVTTVGLKVWHINEYRHFELSPAHHGHFHSGEGYVIRWAYYVLADRIAKDRKSRCRSTVAGRERCAYFFWQGNDCSVNEKGAAAIMAVELDEEKGPQVRVVQGKENPVFLSLFKGGMIIHNGSVLKSPLDPEKKSPIDENTATFSDTSTTRMYVIRNEEPEEACLNQVKARKCVECNLDGLPAVSLSVVEEGSESQDFWKAIGGKKYYYSLANDPSKHNYQPRLFELNSATGKFASSEMLCPSRSEPKLCPFPFIQEDLYTAKQPGLFIIDGYYDVYVWEGWMPEDDDDVRTGSGRQRWDRDRRLAMETALSYAKEAGKRVSHRVYVVYAGMEPMTFKALFPYWNDTPDVIRIQKQDGKQPNTKHFASDLLKQFTKEFYTLSELQKVPPPQGVDPAKLEAYLSDSNFQELFKIDKEAFNKLPGWRQVKLKKDVGLF